MFFSSPSRSISLASPLLFPFLSSHRYDFVYPLSSDRNGPATATPSYPAYLLLAEAISPPSSNASTLQIVYLPQSTSFPDLAVYALYTSSSTLARLVFLNLGAETIDVSLPTSTAVGKKIKRLSSTTSEVGSVVPEDATWNGQSFAQGDAIGTEGSEVVASNGYVEIGAWEGVVVFLDGGGEGDATTGTTGTTTAASTGSATGSPSAPSGTGSAAEGSESSSGGNREISRSWGRLVWLVGGAVGVMFALDFC